jgi:hypothetical protein
MEITNLPTDFKAIDSQDTIASVKDFLMIWLFHTFLLLKKAFQ